MNKVQKIIQLCLHEGGAVKKKLLDIDPHQEKQILSEVKDLLAPLALELIETSESIEICLNRELNEEIAQEKLNDLKTELSESALQTLSIVLYKPNATKPEIDFIRGVDSTRSLKSLQNRGLIEKRNEKNRYFYYPTTETLKFLGVSSVEKLPNFFEISDKLSLLING